MKQRSIPIILGVIVVVAAILLFLPGSKAKRVEKAEMEMQTKVRMIGGREMTSREIKHLKSLKAFHYRTNDGAPQLYVCLPGYGNNISILAWENFRPRLDKFDMYVVPRIDDGSPSSEKALGMCLIQTPDWNIKKLRQAARNMVHAKDAIDAAWLKVSETDRKMIRDTLRVNYENQKDLDEWTFALFIGEKGYFIPGWNQLRPKDHEILDEIANVR